MKTNQIFFKAILWIPGWVFLYLISGCVSSQQSLSPADNMNQQFYQLKNQGKYEQIIKDYQTHLKEAKQKGKRAIQVQSVMILCETYLQNLKDYSKAIEYAQLALQLTEEGLRSGPQNEPDENFGYAINMYGKDRVQAEKVRWYKMGKYRALNNLSSTYNVLGDGKKAAYYAKQAAEMSGYTYSAQETAEQIEKTYAKQAAEMREAKAEFAKKYGEEKAENVYGEMIKKYEAWGEQSGKLIKEEPKQQKDVVSNMKNQAARGDMDGLRVSLKAYLAALSGSSAYNEMKRYDFGPAYIKATTYPRTAAIAYEFGLYQEACDYSKKAIEFQEEYIRLALKNVPKYQHDQYVKGVKEQMFNQNDAIWLITGKALNRLGRYNEAVEYLKKSSPIEKEIGGGLRNQVDAALEMITVRMPRKMEILFELANAYEKSGRKTEAANALGEMVNFFETIRARLTKESQKISYMGTQLEIYDKIIELLLSQGQAGEALDFAERARARAFVDLLGNKELRPKSEKVQSLIVKKKNTQNRYTALIKDRSGDPAARERSIQIVQKEMDGVLNEIGVEDAELLSMTTAGTLKSSEIMEMLDSDTAIAEYYITRDGVIIWIVTRDSIQAKRIAIPEWILAQKVVDFRQRVINPGSQPVKKEFNKERSKVRLQITPARFRKDEAYTIRVFAKNNMPLFLSIDKMDTKIGEYVNTGQEILEKEIPGGEERLIYEAKYATTEYYTINITPGVHQIVLHTDQGELSSNALEIAVDENDIATIKELGAGGKHESVQSDMKKYEEMSLYDILIKPVKHHLTKKRLCIIPHRILHYLPFAALENENRYLIEDYSLVYFTSATVYKFCKNKRKDFWGNIFALGNPDLGQPRLDIPFALKEVDSIGKLYPGSRVLVRAEASEEAFKSHCGSFNVLHLASHGTFDAENPLNSALLLTPSATEDGRLTVNEIFDLELDASLVTLSACQSGMSRIKAGDELMGLPRAFNYAGVPSVVATLWNVSDEATAILMDGFYRNLKVLDKAEALRKAQLKLLKTSRNNNPYYWGAFYLIGDFK